MEKRKYSRTSLISDYHTEFRIKGQPFAKIQVANIGVHGCCLKLPIASAHYLKDKPFLDNMILFHSNAKKYSLKGKVAWHDDGKGTKGQYVTAGVEFLETPEECTREIMEYVAVSTKK